MQFCNLAKKYLKVFSYAFPSMIVLIYYSVEFLSYKHVCFDRKNNKKIVRLGLEFQLCIEILDVKNNVAVN